MKRLRAWLCALCLGVGPVALAQPNPATTAGTIAIANLEQLLAQASEPAARIDLLLAKSRFLADYEALNEAEQLAEALPVDANHLLLRARTRSAAHRFDDALRDLQVAEQRGAEAGKIASQRATILIATGHAADVLAPLQDEAVVHPGYASHSALASAYAELGRYDDADAQYHAALAALHTTSPFPYAWIHFALGLMWTEQVGDARRGESQYAQALAYLPEFVVANIHQAEIEVRRGDRRSAQARLLRVVERTQEPEALALLGALARQRGERADAERHLAQAGERFATLLDRQPLAFVDHAAEYYLAAGADPARAWALAQRNLNNRKTPRAFALALRAAAANGRDARDVRERMNREFDAAHLSTDTRAEWERRAETPGACACP